MSDQPHNFLCVSTFFKGAEFITSCKACGNRVFLLTYKKLENDPWPWDDIEETLYIEEWNSDHVKNGLAYKFRSIPFDRFVALDDFDVERVAELREHFRMPGMGQTTGRHFRDKLSMRMEAKDSGIAVPAYTPLFNDAIINEFADSTEAPWLIKPRHEASATGIKKIHSKDELWQIVHELGDDRHRYLIEKFEPGDVYHADSLTSEGKVLFTSISQYLDTPFEVAHGGGIFRSHTLDAKSDDYKSILRENENVLQAFGLQLGASHTEFIKSKGTGKIYFLETSSRVGGANISDLVEVASGINLWAEWARIESAALRGESYQLPDIRDQYAGIVVSLSRYQHPDYSSFKNEEIAWYMNKAWHIGMIVAADTRTRVLELLDELYKRIGEEFHASLPAPESSHS